MKIWERAVSIAQVGIIFPRRIERNRAWIPASVQCSFVGTKKTGITPPSRTVCSTLIAFQPIALGCCSARTANTPEMEESFPVSVECHQQLSQCGLNHEER